MQQYIIYAWDGDDEPALARRMASREAHFEGARKLKANDHFIIGGAILNDEAKMIGSMMVVQFETKDLLQQWLDAEPYINGKVWQKIEVHPFKVANV